MSERIVKKNFELSEEFSDFTVKHPDIFKNIPDDVCIFFELKDDPNLTKENLKLAKKIIKEEHRKCFKAIKERSRWILEAI